MLQRLTLCLALLILPGAVMADECVVLLHGLLRSAGSMNKIAAALRDEGYAVMNIDYPSSASRVEQLAPRAVEEGLAGCRDAQAGPVHFVTHSMGGILLRQYLANRGIDAMGRAVMLGPPNHGSEVADTLENWPGFDLLTGPAGRQMGTGEDDLPARLGPVAFELGIIAGTSAFNPVFSLMVPSPDDGTVSVASTQVEGMCAMLVLPVTHFLMMRNDEVIQQIAAFLDSGRFSDPRARNGLC